MGCNASFPAGVRQEREGHEFHSCRSDANNEDGFSRWGNRDVPQGLKPSSVAACSARLEVVPFPSVHSHNVNFGCRTLFVWSRA